MHAVASQIRQFVPHRLVEPDRSELTGAVVGEPRRAEQARDARDRHQVAVVTFDHARQERFHRLTRSRTERFGFF